MWVWGRVGVGVGVEVGVRIGVFTMHSCNCFILEPVSKEVAGRGGGSSCAIECVYVSMYECMNECMYVQGVCFVLRICLHRNRVCTLTYSE